MSRDQSPGGQRALAAGQIKVSHHAVERYQSRQRDGSSFFEAEMGVEAEVLAALREGRVQKQKPSAFRMYNERKRDLPSGERFVWSKSGRLGWVIRRVDNGARTLVVTTLTRTVGEA